MHDGKIDIAVGMSAKSKLWKNQKWLWSDLVEKLITEHKTNETFKEFVSATKEEQSKIKDVGGYVGGYLRNGRRKPENVVHRQLITLDIDNAHSNFWNDFQMQFDNAAVLHATHSHVDTNPRYRLVMPLSRECTPDEYVAVSRYIAGMLGIDLFDNTTFESNRLMFWPSSSKDVAYYSESQKGTWVDVDDILNSYVDWTDSSSWPTSESKLREIKDASVKQQDPEEKRGVIGAFCRTYPISEAIDKFLSDSYVDAGQDRYTYTKGSTSAGLTIYDDKFAYSHHGTDPASSKLCNAFDLVRIHKFGHLDTGHHTNKSFAAMEDFCKSDQKVRGTIANEKIAESKYDFAEELEQDQALDLSWATDLEIDGKGKYVSSANNIGLIFNNDQALKNAFKENKFDSKKYIVKSLPWRKIKQPEPIKNVDYSGVRNYFESVYGITGAVKIEDALNLKFEKHSFHPVKEYLNKLKWDGKQRIDTLLIDYFGAEDSIYTREAIRKTLVGSVARIYQPGVKFDLVLTLVGGEQGTGKSSFFRALGQSWFSDSFNGFTGKEAFEQLQGAWIIEMAELAGLRKAERESVKHFITKQEDIFRPAYGRISETYQRQCVFVATTNEREFLSDPTGNRRFIPIEVKPVHLIDNKKLRDFIESKETVDQVWAEAVELFRSHETLYLSKKAENLARSEQKNHSINDERTGLILKYLETALPKDWSKKDVYERRQFFNDSLSEKGTEDRNFVCIAEIWCECLQKEKHDMTRYNTREINEIMKSLEDWEQINSTKNFSIYGTQKYYARKFY
jgi:predicted P-loop ATPase